MFISFYDLCIKLHTIYSIINTIYILYSPLSYYSININYCAINYYEIKLIIICYINNQLIIALQIFTPRTATVNTQERIA